MKIKCISSLYVVILVLQQKNIQRPNAKIHNALCPKSPLEVFNEVYNNIPIKLVETSFRCYTASIEVSEHLFYNLIFTVF